MMFTCTCISGLSLSKINCYIKVLKFYTCYKYFYFIEFWNFNVTKIINVKFFHVVRVHLFKCLPYSMFQYFNKYIVIVSPRLYNVMIWCLRSLRTLLTFNFKLKFFKINFKKSNLMHLVSRSKYRPCNYYPMKLPACGARYYQRTCEVV